MSKPTALIIDDSTDDIALLSGIVRSQYDVATATTCAAGLDRLSERVPDIVLLDLRFPGGESGLEALKEMKAREPSLPVVMVTESTFTADAVECIKAGAFHFVEKEGLSKTALLSLMSKAIEERRNRRAAHAAREEARKAAGDIVGRSPAILDVLRQVEEVAPTDASVLITGESGTGKELVARLVHERSRRRDRQLVTVACPAIPATLMESEFFGAVRGAATGVSEREGRFELADGGTVFLDEIADIDVHLQPKLFRAVENGTFSRVGSSATVAVDVRVVSATSRDVAKMVEAGQFRSELYHRLNTYPIHVPPLRERPEDVPLLVEHFVARYALLLGRPVPRVRPDVVGRLGEYDWARNNVRELKNCVEAALIRCRRDELAWSDFRLLADLEPGREGIAGALRAAREECLARFERAYVERLLRACDGNVSVAAARAGISRRALYAIMRKRGIDPRGFR